MYLSICDHVPSPHFEKDVLRKTNKPFRNLFTPSSKVKPIGGRETKRVADDDACQLANIALSSRKVFGCTFFVKASFSPLTSSSITFRSAILRDGNRYGLRQCVAARSHQPESLKGTRLDSPACIQELLGNEFACPKG
jgi:hypothetical protein